MATDELAEIDGHKPKVLLADGQGREIKSTSSTGATYKIKRTQDSYYCHCPAWRNQKGVPVNARTCKHLRDVLGDEYETARLELKNPNGAPPKPSGKGAAKVPSTSKPASRGKRKRDDDSDEDEEADEEEEDDAPSPKKGRKVVSKSKKPDSDFDEEDESEEEAPQKKAKNKRKGKKKANSESGEDSEEEPRTKTPRKAAASKPKSKGKKKADSDSGEESDDEPRAKKSATKGKGKKKAHSDSEDDSDERPAKKMKPASKGKGKKKAGSDDDDDERPAKKSKPASKAKGRKKPDSDNDDEDDDRPAKKSKPVSKGKGKKKADSDDDDERPAKKSKPASKAKGKKKPDSDDEDEDDERPAKKMKPTSKGKETKVESDSEGENDDEDVKPPKKSPTSVKGTSKSSDPLAEIDGHKPKVLLDDGEDREIQSMSSNSTYKVKRTWDHYYCQCPAWRNQAGAPVDARTCKHLRDLLGDAYEAARIKWKNPNGPPLKPASKKGKAKSKPASKGKRKRDDDDDDDEDDKKPKSKSKRAKVDDDDDDDDEDDSGGKKVPALLLANKWDIETGPDPTGWWISEKLDGVRTFYDGEGMVSRLGNPFTPPQWFLDKLPTDVTLDGELFGGRGKFQDTVSIVKTMNSPHWKGITFQIFDVPSENTVFEDRVAFLKNLFGPGGKYECPEVVLVEHEKAKSRKHVLEKLKEIEELGGEGLMLRRAGSKYEGKRSGTLLKIKTFYDGEAEVTGYTDGKGKHVGLTGALKCKMESGKTFNVGTGLSDKQRKNPPKIGSIITYRFQELTRDGVPRFPSYIGEAIDKKRAKDAKLPAHRKTGAKKDD